MKSNWTKKASKSIKLSSPQRERISVIWDSWTRTWLKNNKSCKPSHSFCWDSSPLLLRINSFILLLKLVNILEIHFFPLITHKQTSHTTPSGNQSEASTTESGNQLKELKHTILWVRCCLFSMTSYCRWLSPSWLWGSLGLFALPTVKHTNPVRSSGPHTNGDNTQVHCCTLPFTDFGSTLTFSDLTALL